MNHNFAKVTSDNRIVYAPDTLGASPRAPSAWQYHSAGYWDVDLIPVRVGQVGLMYDRVSGELFGNSGTGAFVLGPDI